MTESEVQIGFDRFIAKRWADQALRLFVAPGPIEEKYIELRNWLDLEIAGKDVSRKTANQLKRMWLNPKDGKNQLRDLLVTDELIGNTAEWNILHYGMALNVFPIFRDACSLIGKLDKIQGECSSQELKDRLTEKYGRPSSIPRITDRVLQTLKDWELIDLSNHLVRPHRNEVEKVDLAQWFVIAVVSASGMMSTPLADLLASPLKLGITSPFDRGIIDKAKHLRINRDATNHEVVSVIRI